MAGNRQRQCIAVRVAKCVRVVGLVWAALTSTVILAQGPLAGPWAFGLGLFDLLDQGVEKVMLPLAGLMVSLYTAYAWGFDAFREQTNQGASGFRVTSLWKPLVVALIPLAVTIVVLSGWGLLG